ncbi:MAG: TssN family type VI secretion system protein [Bacteroidia bacterium]|nr:TssN family type VI secretion system protein [Bacteroidia bacterium]
MKPEVLKVIMVLLVVSVLIFSSLLAKVEGVKKNKIANLLYILIAGLCIGIMGLTQYLGLTGKPFIFFIVLQVLMLGLGMIHNLTIQKYLQWPSKTSFTGEFLLTLNTASNGGIFLLLAFTVIGMRNFSTLMLSSIVWFLIPFLFIKAMAWYSMIPEKVFKTWTYPVDKPIPDPTDAELASPMVVSFEFQKKVNQEDYTIFRAKAPKDIQFGNLFYFFINDYNSRHPEGTIEVSTKSSPYPWVFHFKPKWFEKTRYLDPDETVFHNQIKENSIIVCNRIFEK